MINRQVLPLKLVDTLLPAEFTTAPAVTETVLRAGGNVRSNWMLETEAVPGSKVIGRSTAVPAGPETVPADIVGAVSGGGGGGGGGGGALTVMVPAVAAPGGMDWPLASE